MRTSRPGSGLTSSGPTPADLIRHVKVLLRLLGVYLLSFPFLIALDSARVAATIQYFPITNHSDIPQCPGDFMSLYKGALASLVFGYNGSACVDQYCGFLVNSTSLPSKLQPVPAVMIPTRHANISSLEDLPNSCQEIHKTDIVGRSNGEDCLRFCNRVLGDAPHFLRSDCSSFLGAGVLHQVCAKASTYKYFDQLPEWSPIAVCVLVFVAGQMLTHIKQLVEGACHDYSVLSSSIPLSGTSEVSPVIPPDPDACLAKGPYLDQSIGRAYHKFPWCFFECKSDLQGSRTQTRTQGATVVSDPFTDIANGVSYLRHGQPGYALVTMIGILVTGDPLQYQAMQAYKDSLKRGWDTKEYIAHKMAEGMWEGTLNASIALYSFIAMPSANITPVDLCLRLVSVCISFGSTIPEGLVARQILNTADSNDFYDTVRVRSKFSRRAKCISFGWFVLVVWMALLHLGGCSSGFICVIPLCAILFFFVFARIKSPDDGRPDDDRPDDDHPGNDRDENPFEAFDNCRACLHVLLCFLLFLADVILGWGLLGAGFNYKLFLTIVQHRIDVAFSLRFEGLVAMIQLSFIAVGISVVASVVVSFHALVLFAPCLSSLRDNMSYNEVAE